MVAPKAHLMEQGITFPEGAWALFDQEKSVLMVFNTLENLEMVDQCFTELVGTGPVSILQTTLEVVEGSEDLIREVGRQASETGSHDRLMERIVGEVDSGKLRRVRTVQFPMHSSTPAKVSVGTERPVAGTKPPVDEPKDDAKGKVVESPAGLQVGTIGSRWIGTRLELESMVGGDGVSLHVEMSLTHDYLAPTTDISGNEVYHIAELKSPFTMRIDSTRFLGMWKATGRKTADGKDVMQAAFLRVNLVSAR